MSSKPFPSDVLTQARSVAEAWKKIDPALKIGELDPAMLMADVQQAAPIQTDIDALDAQLTDLRNQRDSLFAALWDKLKRVRAGVKGIYGDDSSQYEMIGGTRMSERKSPTRKPAASN